MEMLTKVKPKFDIKMSKFKSFKFVKLVHTVHYLLEQVISEVKQEGSLKKTDDL